MRIGTYNTIFIATITFFSIIFSMQMMQEAKAATTFDVGVTVCDAEWYCTNWSSGTCGTRTCIDINDCGTDYDKPGEYIACPEAPPTGRSGGGSSGGGFSMPSKPPVYFVLNLEIIKVEVTEGSVIQRILKVNGTSGEYTLEILYPSAYSRDNGLITTSMSSKYIDGIGDFNLIIDSRNVSIGTYSIPVRIASGRYNRTVNVVIDVIPKDNIRMEVRLDSTIKNLGQDTELKVYTHIEGLSIRGNENIEYTILDPKGNVMYILEKPLNDSLDIEENIVMPNTIDEGYYVISVRVLQGTDEYIKSTTFSVLPLEKYHLIREEPNEGNMGSQRILGILALIIVLMVIINTTLVYKKKSDSEVSEKYERISKSPTIMPEEKPQPKKAIAPPPAKSPPAKEEKKGPAPSKGQGLKGLFGFGKGAKKDSDDNGLETLKYAYNRGFISLPEYRDALKDAGYVEESKKVSAQQQDILKKAEMKEQKPVEVEKIPEDKQKTKASTDEMLKIEQKDNMLLKIGDIFKKDPLNVKDFKEESAGIKESKKELPEKLPELKMSNDASKEDQQKPKNIVSGALTHMFAQNLLDKKVGEKDAFIIYGNQKIYTIRELMNILPKMSDNMFHHHTMHGRNNFADWIADEFKFIELADELREAKTKEEIVQILKRYDD